MQSLIISGYVILHNLQRNLQDLHKRKMPKADTPDIFHYENCLLYSYFILPLVTATTAPTIAARIRLITAPIAVIL